jgi:predicted RNA-binding protein with PIN domain
MRWLIDGYNVIRRDPDLRAREAEGLPAGRAALLRRLAAVARDRDETFMVVFDGARLRVDADASAVPAGRIEVVFSRPPESADDVLRSLAIRWREAAVVVSSDRAVETAARRAGAVAVRVEDFLAALDRAGGIEDKDADDDEEAEDEPRVKHGNPRRASQEQRATRRVLRRLTG